MPHFPSRPPLTRIQQPTRRLFTPPNPVDEETLDSVRSQWRATTESFKRSRLLPPATRAPPWLLGLHQNATLLHGDRARLALQVISDIRELASEESQSPAGSQWACKVCGRSNHPRKRSCRVCSAPAGYQSRQPPPPQQQQQQAMGQVR